jgi:hypothetical protein
MITPGGSDYNLHSIDLPLPVVGAVVLLYDGSYDIFLNALLPDELREKGLKHEIQHIDQGHLYNDVLRVTDMEMLADGKPASPQPDRRVMDVFGDDRKDGYIPVFHSLDSFYGYLVKLAKQKRKEGVQRDPA